MGVPSNVLCCLCGENIPKGPDLCSVNFHYFTELKLNDKGTAFKWFFQQGGAHGSCWEDHVAQYASAPECCPVCDKAFTAAEKKSPPNKLFKIALYRYRKKGAEAVIALHAKCFRDIKWKQFPFMPPTDFSELGD